MAELDPELGAELDPELSAAFSRYEEGLLAGNLAVQRELFWSEPAVVRVDPDGPVIGPDALAAFRAQRPSPGPRRLRSLHTVRSPGETVVTVSVNERLDAEGNVTGLSSQTQVWAHTATGWQVIAACVSPMSGL
jgi:hypothetical protein